MDLIYLTMKSEKYCTDLKQAKRNFGTEAGERLLATINFSESVQSLHDVLVIPRFRLHPLEGKLSNYLSGRLSKRAGDY
ncbi:MAG TPA: hypothetical protein GXZ74_03655 [Tissierellia bacterium]|nr:hypothetical protein [Tissierellia bacterium]